MRVRKKKWAASELESNPLILDETDINISTCFPNPKLPLHLEVGCGKGRFITQMSLKNQEINFFALERDPTIVAQAARLARLKEIVNLRFLIADVDFIENYFKPGDVSRLYINFCDPWPTKVKRARRRLTHDRYIKVYEKLKIPQIFFKTDNRLLFEFSIESFSRNKWLISNVSLDLHKSDYADNIVTEYEEKFSAYGPIYRLEAFKSCE